MEELLRCPFYGGEAELISETYHRRMIELNKIYNEDCLIGMQRIPDGSVDMILCDLPYGTTACKWDTVIPFEPLWEQYERIIKPNGAIVLTASQPFTTDLICSNRRLFRYEIIWQKSNFTGFLSSTKRPLKAHENVLVFSKKQCIYNPQKFEVSDKFRDKRKTINNTPIKEGVLGKINRIRKADDGMRFPTSILPVENKPNGSLHPTQKPVALFEYLIKTYTNEGETVLDNCMGSGTTAIACINTKRNYIGFELDAHYCEIANERIQNAIAAWNRRVEG